MLEPQVRTTSMALREKDLAFGNPFGQGWKAFDWDQLKRQLGAIDSERKEVQEGFDEKDPLKVIDGLMDIVVFIEETMHKAGLDYDSYLMKVTDSLFSRLCKDQDVLDRTVAFYKAKGVQLVVEGEFPTKCVKSAVDQWLGADGSVYETDQGEGTFEYPKGKFLKGIDYHKPDIRLPDVPLHLQAGD